MTSPVGFVGIGMMGEPMSLNLLRAGTPVIVWNRSPTRLKIVADAGATVASSVRDVFAQASTVFVMLFDRQALDVTLARGTSDFAPMVAGRTLINLGSMSPEDSIALGHEIVAAGGRFVESPVSGSRIPAERGQLVAMLAGDESTASAVRPLFAPMCKEAIYCGPLGNGLRMKPAVNLFLLVMVNGLNEAVHFADRNGLDRTRLQAVLNAGPMASTVSRLKLASLIAGDFTPFTAIKDALNSTDLITTAATLAGANVPLIQECRAIYRESTANGLGGLDMMAVIQTMERRSAGTS
jgi:3-hydroxyisobutyrate dehydrogenase